MPFLVKKEAALRAEANFFDLLRGIKSLTLASSWKEVKCFFLNIYIIGLL